MRVILLVLASLFVAAPSWAAGCGKIRNPASTVCFTDVTTAQEKHDTALSKCLYLEAPVQDESLTSIWRAPTAVTITEIWCQVTAETSVDLDLEVDDGSATGVNGSDITCTTAANGVSDSTLAGDTTMADGNRLDLVLGTVTGAVTALEVCWEFTID